MSADPFSANSADGFAFGEQIGAPAGPQGAPGGPQPMPGQPDMAMGAATVYPDPAAMALQQPIQQPIRSDDMPAWERRRRVRLQARKVRRIIRHIEPWSVLKVSAVFYLCLWVIFVLAGVLIWSVADSSGSIEKVEALVRELLALDTFALEGEWLFNRLAIGGLILAIAGTAFNVLLCVLFNLISDLMGGVRLTVIEEESARFRPPRRRAPKRSR